MNYLRNKIKSNNKFIYLCFFAISMALALYNIKQLDMITILNDEFGYWGNAAFFTNRNWNSLMSVTPFYSMGYSVLLIPIMLFIKNEILLYQSAIVINGVLIFICLLLSYNLTESLFYIEKESERVVAVIISVLSVSTIFNMQVAWTESLLTTLFILILFFLHKFEEKCEWKYLIGIGISCFCSLEAHKRFIPIILICICFTILILLRKKKYTMLVFAFLFFAGAALIYKYANTWQVDTVYNYSTFQDHNNISVVSGANNIISVFRIKEVFESLLGKVVSFSLSTFFIGPMGICLSIGSLLNKVKTKQIKNISFSKTFMVICPIIMIALSAMQMHGYFRKDVPSYSRYFDFVLSPIVLLGCSYLFSSFKKNKKIYLFILLFSVISTIALYLITKRCERGYNIPCNPFIGAFYCLSMNSEEIKHLDENAFILIIKFIILEGVIIPQLFSKRKYSKCYFLVILFSTVYLAWNSNMWLNQARDLFRSDNAEIIRYIQNDDEKLYFVSMKDQTDTCLQAKYLQFAVGERSIIVIPEEELSTIDDDSWILANKEYHLDDKYGYKEYASSNMNLYKKVEQ